MGWAEIKALGSEHYKGGETEPIDLYRSGDMLRHFALCSIIKYAFRNRFHWKPVNFGDMDKIIHYAKMLKWVCRDEFGTPTAAGSHPAGFKPPEPRRGPSSGQGQDVKPKRLYPDYEPDLKPTLRGLPLEEKHYPTEKELDDLCAADRLRTAMDKKFDP